MIVVILNTYSQSWYLNYIINHVFLTSLISIFAHCSTCCILQEDIQIFAPGEKPDHLKQSRESPVPVPSEDPAAKLSSDLSAVKFKDGSGVVDRDRVLTPAKTAAL